MANYNSHQILVNEILVALSKSPLIRVWANNTGTAKSFDGERVIKFGLSGSADILGIIGPSGKFIAIECKTGNAIQSASQKNFSKMITDRGGIYIIARTVLDTLKAVNDSRFLAV